MTICYPAKPGQTIAEGNYELNNKSSSTVTIQSVTLGSPRGIKMTGGAWIVPYIHNDGIGEAFWPPTAPAWAQRRRADGAQIKPGQDWNLIVGVARTTTKTGRYAGLVIRYSADGSTYTWQEDVAVELGTGKCVPYY